jgi:hypothetical protein
MKKHRRKPKSLVVQKTRAKKDEKYESTHRTIRWRATPYVQNYFNLVHRSQPDIKMSQLIESAIRYQADQWLRDGYMPKDIRILFRHAKIEDKVQEIKMKRYEYHQENTAQEQLDRILATLGGNRELDDFLTGLTKEQLESLRDDQKELIQLVGDQKKDRYGEVETQLPKSEMILKREQSRATVRRLKSFDSLEKGLERALADLEKGLLSEKSKAYYVQKAKENPDLEASKRFLEKAKPMKGEFED